ncbi:MAG TPA: 6-phospho-beta-glucosidase [Actinomycetota bacterium]|nr:6-phospho-beta-glucosidase [Actinomycetota bacterium]
MKVAVLGGGGFRTPTLHSCLARANARIGVEEVVLQDVDPTRLDLILDVIVGMDRERGGAAIAVRTTTSLDDAVDGAGAVLAAIRVGGADARVIDEEVPLSLGVLGQETVGPAGIAFAMRTIPVMRAIALTVRDRAPDAWFVNFTNPAGVVTEALREMLGDRAVGICDSPAGLCARTAVALRQKASSMDFDYGGLNHLGWLLAARVEGEDRLPELLADDVRIGSLDEARLFGVARLRSLRAIPNEYLVYLDRTSEVTAAFRRQGGRGNLVAKQQRQFFERRPGDPSGSLAAWRATRDARHSTYMAEAWEGTAQGVPETGAPPDQGPGEEGYAAVAVNFFEAVVGDEPAQLILNTANRGRLTEVGDDEVGEITCTVSSDGIRPVPGSPLPSEASTLVTRIKEVERLTLVAATRGSAPLAIDALAAHPTVPSREIAERIWSGYVGRHESLRVALR